MKIRSEKTKELHVKRIKAILLFTVFFVSASVFSVTAYATEVLDMPEGYEEILGAASEEIDKLPEELFSRNAYEAGEALESMSTPEYVLSLIADITGAEIGGAARLFISISAVLIIASAVNAMRASLSSASLGAAMRFCTTGAMMAALIGVQFEHIERVSDYFERLTSLMEAMIPVGGTVLAMGGNVSSAASGSATLAVIIGVSQALCSKSVIPVVCACTALAICNTLSPDVGLNGFASAIKKTYTFILGTVMTVLIATLSSQTALTAAADTAGARTAKLVSGMAIPIVGGTVGDTLRTVAGGVSYLKSVVGIGAVFIIVLMLLPILISLILSRLAFLLAGGVADMLGCESEGKFISELGSIWGTMIAVVAMTSVMFILALVMFVKMTVAVA